MTNNNNYNIKEDLKIVIKIVHKINKMLNVPPNEKNTTLTTIIRRLMGDCDFKQKLLTRLIEVYNDKEDEETVIKAFSTYYPITPLKLFYQYLKDNNLEETFQQRIANRLDTRQTTLNRYLCQTFVTDYINSAFTWFKTKEGDEFWYAHHKKWERMVNQIWDSHPFLTQAVDDELAEMLIRCGVPHEYVDVWRNQTKDIF